MPYVPCACVMRMARVPGEEPGATARRALRTLARHDCLANVEECSCVTQAQSDVDLEEGMAEHLAALALLVDVAEAVHTPERGEVPVFHRMEAAGFVYVDEHAPGKRPRTRKAEFIDYDYKGHRIRGVMGGVGFHCSDATPATTPRELVREFAQLSSAIRVDCQLPGSRRVV